MYLCAPCRICRFVSNLWRLLHLFGKRDVSIGKCALESKKLKKWKIGRIPMEELRIAKNHAVGRCRLHIRCLISFSFFICTFVFVYLFIFIFVYHCSMSNRWAAGHKAAASLPSRSGQARCGGQQSGAESHQHRLLALRHPGLGLGMMIQHIQPIPSIT